LAPNLTKPKRGMVINFFPKNKIKIVAAFQGIKIIIVPKSNNRFSGKSKRFANAASPKPKNNNPKKISQIPS
jgi:hypothetical protein